jgi:hypothetical protein
LKKRHELVELRREQYTLRDSFSETIMLREPALVNDEATRPQLNADIEVLPLGTCGQGERSALIFRPWEEIIPTNYTEEQLQLISNVYWAK